MQTFLPYLDFRHSAAVLDCQHLDEQRVKNLQIMQSLLQCRIVTKNAKGSDIPQELWTFEPVQTLGWARHPAVLMWQGYELLLLMYQAAITDEWVERGYSDTCMVKTAQLYHNNYHYAQRDSFEPPWLGDADFHESHQSSLVRKDPVYYRRYFPDISDDLPNVWPVSAQDRFDI